MGRKLYSPSDYIRKKELHEQQLRDGDGNGNGSRNGSRNGSGSLSLNWNWKRPSGNETSGWLAASLLCNKRNSATHND